jgi:hypothetical protein
MSTKRYRVVIATRNPLLLEVMAAMKEVGRLNHFLAMTMEAYLTTEDGKRAARRVLQSSEHGTATSPQSISPPADSRQERTGHFFDLDTLLGK